mgnify:CR=1 FL=1
MCIRDSLNRYAVVKDYRDTMTKTHHGEGHNIAQIMLDDQITYLKKNIDYNFYFASRQKNKRFLDYWIKKFNEDPGLFTTRVVDCHLDAYIKISEGKSFKEMEKNYGPPGDLIPITRKSILYQYRDFICGEKVFSKKLLKL